MDNVTTRVEAVRSRIAAAESGAGRTAGSVLLLAVSKTKPAGALAMAYAAGQRHFGESYLQEALAKREAFDPADAVWHFIGPLQSNKTRPVAERFDWVHGVDRLKLALRLSEQRPAEMPPLQLCIQVNVSGEASKSGCTFDELPDLAAAIAELPRLRLRGLMAIPAPTTDGGCNREPFRRLRLGLEQLNRAGLALDTLSMGMSDDLEAAIAEGATIVRVGSALFGARDYAGTGPT